MWLKYGVDESNILVTISEVASGKTNLLCPFCSSQLTAKKGKIKQHHFAHTVETCLRVRKGKLPSLPLYDNFNLQLSGQEWQQVKQLWREYGNSVHSVPVVSFRLVLAKLFVFNAQSLGYDFTNLGKIPVGALPLAQFNKVQEPLLLEELEKLTGAAERAQLLKSTFLNERITDLRYYRAQLRRILQLKLYFLEIRVNGETLHKIGVTGRSMKERMAEVKRDLQKYYQQIEIQISGTWEHRGNVELYFKHRYQAFNYPIGTLTEYYKFKEIEPVLSDLQQMTPKILSYDEMIILQEQ